MCAYKSIKIIVISLAVPVDNMKQILYSDWLFEGHKMSPSCPLGIARFDPVQEKGGGPLTVTWSPTSRWR